MFVYLSHIYFSNDVYMKVVEICQQLYSATPQQIQLNVKNPKV